MKKALTFAAALTVAASASQAAGPGTYTMEVVRNGVTYMCDPNIVVIDGVRSRNCIRARGASNVTGGGSGGLFGGGIGAGGIGLGLLGVVVLAAAISGGDDDATNGTN